MMKHRTTTSRRPFYEDRFTGPLLTLIVLLLIEPLNHLFPFAGLSPIPFYFTMVVFSAFMGGTRSALFSSGLGAVYCIQYYWLHGDFNLLLEGDDFYRVLQVIVSGVIISLLAGSLKEKTLKPYKSALSANERLLRQKTVDLMKSNADLENFLHMASHDLKSPLFNLEGLIGILREEVGPNPNDEVNSVLRQMEKTMFAMHQTLHMVQSHMQSSSLQAQEQTACNLQELIDEIKGSISIMIAESGADIKTNFSEVTEFVYTRGKLHSILYNLITNAIKYRHSDRKPVVQVKASRHDDFCILEITDNGLGIDMAKDGENLFRVFKRLHNHVEGTGVGLYLIKQIAESTGGHIEVSSTPGTGSTFKVFLKTTKIRPLQGEEGVAALAV